ncbi:MAG: serine/threonine protein kinase [Planctomycetes bacterium]|nr:serine/threonine protein kinase [Planctomycetota bacterium]
MADFKTCVRCSGVYVGSICPTCVDAMPAPEPSPDPLRPGQSFRGLEVVERLGRGGMGVVYKARQPALGRFVALKVLRPDKAGQADWQARFEREARALAGLSHSGIVAVHDFGVEEDLFFLTMEFVDGSDLWARMAGRRLPTDEALAIATQICDALAYAHAAGIVHRDIKPGNVLIDGTGRVKIADFGLAKLAGPASDAMLTQSGVSMGTHAYMAPEQMENTRDVDHRADLYAAGVVLYEMLTGELPVGRFEPPSAKGADARLDAVVLRALAKDPSRRHPDAAELKEDLARAVAARPEPAKHTSRIWLLAPAALLLAVAGLLLLRSRKMEEPRAQEPAPVPADPAAFEEVRAFTGHDGAVWCVAVAPDGRAVASGGKDRTLRLWPEGRVLPGHEDAVLSVAVSPDGRTVASGGRDRTVRLWPISGGEGRVLARHEDAVRTVAFRPDGRAVASGSPDGVVKIWDLDGREIGAISETLNWVTCMAYGPDGTVLATGNLEKTVRILDAAPLKGTKTLRGHDGKILGVAFGPDGKTLASASEDGTVRLWDLAAGKELLNLRGHSGPVASVSFHPAGKALASAGEDGTIRIWDAESGRELRRLAGHAGAVQSVAFGADGRTLASGGRDGTVRLWGPRR